MPPATGEVVDSVPEDKPGSWYEFMEEIEEGDEAKHGGQEEVEEEKGGK